MGSSVRLYAGLWLWITFCLKMSIRTTTPWNFAFPGDKLWIKLRYFLYRYTLEVVFVEIKTTGYEA